MLMEYNVISYNLKSTNHITTIKWTTGTIILHPSPHRHEHEHYLEMCFQLQLYKRKGQSYIDI